jgi:hypothetical protein
MMMPRIFDCAKVADWDHRLETLAGMAEPERWRYLCAPSRLPLPVLGAFDQQKLSKLTG